MLEVKDVELSYGKKLVLNGVSLSVKPGEIVALVGENGCGKSSLGRVLCAMQLVDRGIVSVDGHNASVSELERLEVRKLVAYVQQDPVNQIVSSLVYDEVAFGQRNLGCTEDKIAQRASEALAAVGLTGFEARVTTELSGGEQQRLAFASVLAMQPRYLVLDEPTAQLDPSAREKIRALIQALAHDEGLGIVLITHDELEIALAHRVVSLNAQPCDVLNKVNASKRDACLSHSDKEQLPECCELRHSSQPVLTCSNVSFSYNNMPLISHLSFELGSGESLLLSGPSGVGKSTLASLIAGLLQPVDGSITVNGAAPHPGSVGLSLQQPESQFFLDTVFEEIAFAPKNAGLSQTVIDERVHWALALVGLDEHMLQSYPFELSGGQARRVALASTLALDAPVYVFDEPTAALDAKGRQFAHRLVQELTTLGKAVVVISHDLDEWRSVCTREIALQKPLKANLSLDAIKTPQKHKQPFHGHLKPFGSYKADSLLARLDARVKIALLFAFTLTFFLISSPPAFVGCFIALAVALCAASMNLWTIARALKPVVIVLLFALLTNAVSCTGGSDIAIAGQVGINIEGAVRGLTAVARIVLLVDLSIVVASTTPATQISDACVRLLKPLAHFGVPVGTLGTVLSLALRFIPLTGEELMRIRTAQRARGVEFSSGTLAQRMRSWLSVFTPLLVGLFLRADRLAEAMQARCYGMVAEQVLPVPRALTPKDSMVLMGGLTAALLLCVIG